MQTLKRIVVATIVVIVATASVALLAVEVRWRRTFDAPFPPIAASRDPAAIERGRYLVYGPAACAYCHVPKDEWPRLDRGEELPLAGKHLFRLPFGEFYSANLTPDAATGIGRRSDVGPRFGGGQRMDVAADPKMVFVPPNLTPDPETSPIGMWSEDDFVGRMRGGERILGTLMPWGAYGRMTDDDLRSVYRYLRSLPPYRHETGPRIQPR